MIEFVDNEVLADGYDLRDYMTGLSRMIFGRWWTLGNQDIRMMIWRPQTINGQ
jgi:hypothetical protein